MIAGLLLINTAVETEAMAEPKYVSEMVLRLEWCFKDQKVLAHVLSNLLLYSPELWVLSSLLQRRNPSPEMYEGS